MAGTILKIYTSSAYPYLQDGSGVWKRFKEMWVRLATMVRSFFLQECYFISKLHYF